VNIDERLRSKKTTSRLDRRLRWSIHGVSLGCLTLRNVPDSRSRNHGWDGYAGRCPRTATDPGRRECKVQNLHYAGLNSSTFPSPPGLSRAVKRLGLTHGLVRLDGHLFSAAVKVEYDLQPKDSIANTNLGRRSPAAPCAPSYDEYGLRPRCFDRPL